MAFYRRSSNAGKPHKVALIAAMRSAADYSSRKIATFVPFLNLFHHEQRNEKLDRKHGI